MADNSPPVTLLVFVKLYKELLPSPPTADIMPQFRSVSSTVQQF